MISRMTIFSFLLTLLVAAGVWRWYVRSGDLCARYLAGDRKLPAEQYVVTGTRTVVVPCTEWLPRMPVAVQMICLLGLGLAFVFVIYALGDLRAGFEAWLRWRR